MVLVLGIVLFVFPLFICKTKNTKADQEQGNLPSEDKDRR